MGWRVFVLLVIIYIYDVNADCYLHSPPGCNNRLDGTQRERRTDNRIFDSQNNDRGGYNVGGDANRAKTLGRIFRSVSRIRDQPGIRAKAEEEQRPPGKMSYYTGSILSVSWTNQHQCGGANTHCELVLQYMCGENLRDGFSTRRIPDPNGCGVAEDGKSRICDTDRTYGMHEDTSYYTYCKARQRNKGLFTADQKLKGERAIYTRQNADGDRNGYECPEERDYYPYWNPTPWIDIAVMTNNVSRCDYYKQQSENVEPRWYCKIPDKTMLRLKLRGTRNRNDQIPITEEECKKATFDGEKGEWVRDTSRTIHPPPECIFSPKSRDNHNGNGPSGFPNSYNWTLPNTPHKSCALRLRYNISTLDYDWSVDSKFNAKKNNEPTTLDIGAVIGGNSTEAKLRGFVFKGNPTVKPLKIEGPGNIGAKLKLRLAINTAQFGRTFQDRSHSFSIKERPNELKGKTIYNMGVQGKRGNIVQVYPAVEYDYWPNRMEVVKDDYVHIQWTGSDKNPANNNGNGKAGTDRSNMVLLTSQNYPEGTPGVAIAENLKNGHLGNSYPARLDDAKTLLGLPFDTRQYLALTVNELERTLVKCERSVMEIKCPGGMVVNVTYAHFGLKEVNCANTEQSMAKSKQTCDKKNACRLSVESRTFTDPCRNVKKCLEVKYTCLFDGAKTTKALKDLDGAHPYFNLEPQQMSKLGEYKYMCTRNNDFTNRSQKGRMTVRSNEETVPGGNGGAPKDEALDAVVEDLELDSLFKNMLKE